MKKVFMALACACVLALLSCGKTDGTNTDDLYIPDISATTWTNVADANDQYFFFSVVNDGKASSTFDGNNNVSGGGQDSFSGSYVNSKITFTYTSGAKNGQKYSGTISGKAPGAKMVLTTPSGTITLQQQ